MFVFHANKNENREGKMLPFSPDCTAPYFGWTKVLMNQMVVG